MHGFDHGGNANGAAAARELDVAVVSAIRVVSRVQPARARAEDRRRRAATRGYRVVRRVPLAGAAAQTTHARRRMAERDFRSREPAGRQVRHDTVVARRWPLDAPSSFLLGIPQDTGIRVLGRRDRSVVSLHARRYPDRARWHDPARALRPSHRGPRRRRERPGCGAAGPAVVVSRLGGLRRTAVDPHETRRPDRRPS